MAAHSPPTNSASGGVSPAEAELCRGIPPELHDALRRGYKEDNFIKLVIDGPEKYGSFFTERDGILFHSTDGVSVATCIPDSLFKGRRVRELVISHYHETLGHLGFRKTLAAIRTQVWWPSIHADTSAFCKSCATCAMIKSSTQAPLGLAHPLPVPRAPWEVISMDFVGPFPPSHGLDYLWVIVDKLDQHGPACSHYHPGHGEGVCQALSGPGVEVSWTSKRDHQ